MRALGRRRPVAAAIVEEAFETWTERPAADGPGRWELALSNGKPVAGEVRLEDDWLVLDVPLGEPELAGPEDPDLVRRTPWALLALNGRLSRGARCVLAGDPAAPSIHLRSELPAYGGGRLAERVARARDGLVAGLLAFEAHEVAGDGSDAEGPDAPPPAEAAPWVTGALAESGWAYREQESGELSVDLDVPGLARRARLAGNGRRNGDPLLSVTLVQGTPEGERGRRAMAWFLLRATAGVRLARPTTGEESGKAVIRLEADLPANGEGEELADALEALSLAVRELSREAAVLGSDDPLAETYLALLGVSGPAPRPRAKARKGSKSPANGKRGANDKTRKERKG